MVLFFRAGSRIAQAVVAVGANPGSAYDALASYQLGCSDPATDRGAFFYPPSRGANLLATRQGLPADPVLTCPA